MTFEEYAHCLGIWCQLPNNEHGGDVKLFHLRFFSPDN